MVQTAKDSSGILQDYVKELLSATRNIESHVTDKTRDSVDLDKVLDFSATVEAIHKRLNNEHDPTEGRAKVIERFFNKWNNLVLGVFYISGIVKEKKNLSERQFQILNMAIHEIIRYAEKPPS